MRRALSSLCAFAVAALFVAAAHARQPNIILFLVDDMGWEDSSVPFWRADDGSARPVFLNARYRTPNMLR
ncbi:MAG: sulfatase, partial [Akkermansia sp.]|nr:sulfatase [Akkermansia sp.]